VQILKAYKWTEQLATHFLHLWVISPSKSRYYSSRVGAVCSWIHFTLHFNQPKARVIMQKLNKLSEDKKESSIQHYIAALLWQHLNMKNAN